MLLDSVEAVDAEPLFVHSEAVVPFVGALSHVSEEAATAAAAAEFAAAAAAAAEEDDELLPAVMDTPPPDLRFRPEIEKKPLKRDWRFQQEKRRLFTKQKNPSLSRVIKQAQGHGSVQWAVSQPGVGDL